MGCRVVSESKLYAFLRSIADENYVALYLNVYPACGPLSKEPGMCTRWAEWDKFLNKFPLDMYNVSDTTVGINQAEVDAFRAYLDKFFNDGLIPEKDESSSSGNADEDEDMD